jgi:hypothetical protein
MTKEEQKQFDLIAFGGHSEFDGKRVGPLDPRPSVLVQQLRDERESLNIIITHLIAETREQLDSGSLAHSVCTGEVLNPNRWIDDRRRPRQLCQACARKSGKRSGTMKQINLTDSVTAEWKAIEKFDGLLVIRLPTPIQPWDMKSFVAEMRETFPSLQVVVLFGQQTIEQLSDSDLEAAGLCRIDIPTRTANRVD